MRLLHKFTILLIILVVGSSFVQFFVFDQFFLTTTDSLLLATNEKAANNIGNQLLADFKRTEVILKDIASDPQIRGNQELLDKINGVIPEVHAILIIDRQGAISLGSGVEGFSNINLSQRDYFQHALQGETYISGVYTSAQGRDVVAIATPIIEKGIISGVVVGVVRIHEENLTSLFNNTSFGRDGFIAITDGLGMIVYHPDQERIGKRTELFDDLQGDTGAMIMKNYSGREQYIGYSKIPELNWRVVVMTPTAQLAHSRAIMIYQIIGMSIVRILVVIVVGIYIGRHYMKPFDRLIEAFSTIKNGKYNEIASYGYAHEFDGMIQVYNNTIKKLAEDHATLQVAADIDGLTGTYNRRSFEKILELVKVEAQSGSLESLAIMIVDLDYFKQVNDKHGHLAGDDVLKKIAAIAVGCVGNRSVFRFGGDEFAIVLRNIPQQRSISLAEDIRCQCAQASPGYTVSIGIATYPRNSDSIDEVLNFADKALYMSKVTKNRVTEYPLS